MRWNRHSFFDPIAEKKSLGKTRIALATFPFAFKAQGLKFDIRQSAMQGQFYAVRREPHSQRKSSVAVSRKSLRLRGGPNHGRSGRQYGRGTGQVCS